MLAIHSGKGGVGKTTVTVNLALALSLAGYRVGIFDADIYGPNVPLMLGIRREAESKGWLTVGRVENKPYIPPLERFGLRIMSLGLLVGSGEAVAPDPRFAGLIATRTLKDVLWGELDYLLLDMPPGTGEPQQSLIQTMEIDAAVLVSTPQEMAQLDVGRGLDMFGKAGIRVLGLVENMSYVLCPDCGKHIEVFKRGEHANSALSSVPVLARIPLNQPLSERITPGHPLLTGAPDPTTAVFRELSGQIASALPPV